MRHLKALPFVLLALSTLFAGCDVLTGTSNIEYSVTGSSGVRVSLTYETEGGTSQISSTPVPWSYSRKAKKGDFLYVSAQIVQGTGSVTASINKGGSVFKTATSSGFASIATASGGLE